MLWMCPDGLCFERFHVVEVHVFLFVLNVSEAVCILGAGWYACL